MTRTYQEIQEVLRRIKRIAGRYLTNVHIGIVNDASFYMAITMSPNNDSTSLYIRRDLLENGTWEQIEDSLAHEIAHVIETERFNITDTHGQDWYDIARALGSKGEAFEFYPNVKHPLRYKFRCADCGYTVLGINDSPLHCKEAYNHMYYTTRYDKTRHNKWYVLDEITGRRWTESVF